jgi:hypothetical protein
MKRNHVGTIGDQVRLGHTLTLSCDNCLHRADMDLVEANGSIYPFLGMLLAPLVPGVDHVGHEILPVL